MDRFIAENISRRLQPFQYLKSNMDRFIAKFIKNLFAPHDYLKSNMDRFIAKPDISFERLTVLFKIQYG